MPYTVEATGICKSFGSHRVLDHVNLAIEDGTVLALLGTNGAGKTTLVRILSTLISPDSGTASIAGHDLRTDSVGVRGSISLTGQFAAVDELLTGRENLELMARLRRVPRRTIARRVAELLTEFDLVPAAERRVATYSGGMTRRLDLAISMLDRPRLLFLDEPTTGLDPRSREQLWTSVRALVAGGMTVLLTTQYLEEADRLADTIGLLHKGRIVAQGSAEELKAGLGTEVLRLHFADTASYRRAKILFAAARAEDDQRFLEIPTTATAHDVQTVLASLASLGDPSITVSLHRPSLDDVFLTLTEPAPATPGRPADRPERPPVATASREAC